MKEILIFQTANGKKPVIDWIESLDESIQPRFGERIKRLQTGNYGDYKKITDELYELRFKFGSGYRIYYSEIEDTIILLLCAGDKSTQTKDIKKVKEYLIKYKEAIQNETFC